MLFGRPRLDHSDEVRLLLSGGLHSLLLLDQLDYLLSSKCRSMRAGAWAWLSDGDAGDRMEPGDARIRWPPLLLFRRSVLRRTPAPAQAVRSCADCVRACVEVDTIANARRAFGPLFRTLRFRRTLAWPSLWLRPPRPAGSPKRPPATPKCRDAAAVDAHATALGGKGAVYGDQLFMRQAWALPGRRCHGES
jgi:hypothetical protein